MGLSAAIRKASELGRRGLALALAQPRMVTPEAEYGHRAHDGVLILQRGDNASTDYYLRPRLAHEGAPAVIADIDSDPAAYSLLRQGLALMVVVCRYISPAWLDALEAARPRLARVVFFADDDLPAMMRDADLPLTVRGKVAGNFGSHVSRLSALASEVWLSTPALVQRYPEALARLLPPVPEAEYQPPPEEAPPLAVYHATDVHAAERRFVLEIAALLATRAPQLVLEITGDDDLRRRASGLANVRVVGQQSWPDFRDGQALTTAAMSLAPLTSSAVNAARAPVKAFDAARLGAAGLYADVATYRGFVRDGEDGLLLPMQPQAWAEAVAGLLADPARRLALARAAHERLAALRRSVGGWPTS